MSRTRQIDDEIHRRVAELTGRRNNPRIRCKDQHCGHRPGECTADRAYLDEIQRARAIQRASFGTGRGRPHL